MTTSVPAGQTDVDDWFDLDKYKQAAEVAYGFSKKKMEEAGLQERETIGKGATEQRTSAEQAQQFVDDNLQAVRRYILLQQHHEFVAAKAGNRVAGTHATLHPLRDLH